MRSRLVMLVGAALVAALVLAGCSTQARAERKGKEAGDQICKAKNANSADQAQRHLNSANNKLNDLARFTGRDVHEDVRDLDRNLNQLSRGNASNQDVNAIVRSIEDARSAAKGNAVAAYDGLLEALANCD
jgi:outer membrane murein-binding lipoprotein Lpp